MRTLNAKMIRKLYKSSASKSKSSWRVLSTKRSLDSLVEWLWRITGSNGYCCLYALETKSWKSWCGYHSRVQRTRAWLSRRFRSTEGDQCKPPACTTPIKPPTWIRRLWRFWTLILKLREFCWGWRLVFNFKFHSHFWLDLLVALRFLLLHLFRLPFIRIIQNS